FRFNITFPCGPENAEKLTEMALQEVQKIVDNGPEEKDLVKYKEGELLDYKESIKQNRFWLGYLTSQWTDNTSPERIFTLEERIKAVTAKQVQKVAKKYLTKDKVIGMLMPEETN